MSKPSSQNLAFRIFVCASLALLLIGCGSTSADSKQKGGGKGGRGGGQAAIPVAVAKAEIRDLPVLLNGLGSVEAYNTVAVKTRIDGQLLRAHSARTQRPARHH